MDMLIKKIQTAEEKTGVSISIMYAKKKEYL